VNYPEPLNPVPEPLSGGGRRKPRDGRLAGHRGVSHSCGSGIHDRLDRCPLPPTRPGRFPRPNAVSETSRDRPRTREEIAWRGIWESPGAVAAGAFRKGVRRHHRHEPVSYPYGPVEADRACGDRKRTGNRGRGVYPGDAIGRRNFPPSNFALSARHTLAKRNPNVYLRQHICSGGSRLTDRVSSAARPPGQRSSACLQGTQWVAAGNMASRSAGIRCPQVP
jgi:hypothetical protein